MGFNPIPVRDFIGNGLIFPIQLDNNGRGILASGFDLIRASIKTILAFKVGSRFFLPEFGSRLEELIEEPNDEVLKNLITTFIVGSIKTWEKRVSQIDAQVISINDSSVQVSITYQIKNSQTVDNFIYPFYKQLIY
jgi:phage baseplate assembly protein W